MQVKLQNRLQIKQVVWKQRPHAPAELLVRGSAAIANPEDIDPDVISAQVVAHYAMSFDDSGAVCQVLKTVVDPGAETADVTLSADLQDLRRIFEDVNDDGPTLPVRWLSQRELDLIRDGGKPEPQTAADLLL